MAIFKAKLTAASSGSTTTGAQYYGNGGHPFVGYTMITKGKVGNYGVFANNSICKEYLQRHDTADSSISGKYVIDLNDIYETVIPQTNSAANTVSSPYVADHTISSRDKKNYLPCANLAKNIGKNNSNGFNHYLCIDESNSAITSIGGYPIPNNNSKAEFTLPYSDSTNATSNKIYVNFMAFGYCKSNTPYLGIGSFLSNTASMTSKSDAVTKFESEAGSSYNVKWNEKDATMYEYPKYSFFTPDITKYITTDILTNYGDWGSIDGASSVSDALIAYANVIYDDMDNYDTNSGANWWYGTSSEYEAPITGTIDFKTFMGGKNVYIINTQQSKIYRVSCTVDYAPYKTAGYTTNANGIRTYSQTNPHSYAPTSGVKTTTVSGAVAAVRIGINTRRSATVEYYTGYQSGDKWEQELNPMPGTGTGPGSNTGSTTTTTKHTATEYFFAYVSITLSAKAVDPASDLPTGFPSPYSLRTSSATSLYDWLENIPTVYSSTNMYRVVTKVYGSVVASGYAGFKSGYPSREWLSCKSSLENGSFNRFDLLSIKGASSANLTTAVITPEGEKNIDASINSYIIKRNNNNRLDSSLMSLFDMPDSSCNGTFPGYVSSCKATKTGMLYVSGIKLILSGDTRTLSNTVHIYNVDGQVSSSFKLNATSGITKEYDESRNVTIYTKTFTASTSVSPAYINGGTSATTNTPTKKGMMASQCGMQQLVRSYNSDMNKNYIQYLNTDTNSMNSQWNAVKIAGTFAIAISGQKVYASGAGNDDIIIEGIDVIIGDTTQVTITPTIAALLRQYVYEGAITSNTFKSKAHALLHFYHYGSGIATYGVPSTTMKNVFLSSMTGRTSTRANSKLYNDASILSDGFGSTKSNGFMAAVPTNSSGTPEIYCASYANSFKSTDIYTNSTFNASVSLSDVTFEKQSSDIVDANFASTGTLKNTNYYEVKETTGNTSTNLLAEFSGSKNYMKFKLPTPDLSLSLIYDSVEFNGISAWTFTRSMPLNAASKSNPHMLIYKVEAWVEQPGELGERVVDASTTAKLMFTSEDGLADSSASIAYSGWRDNSSSQPSRNTGYGINEIEFARDKILNNIYLKYNDNKTTVQNAVATSLPINVLSCEGSTRYEYYGGASMPFDVKEVEYNEDESIIYANMYSTMVTSISSSGGKPICMCGCAANDSNFSLNKPYMTKDGHKIIYLGIGFYNTSLEIMPINALFSIKYEFTNPDTGLPGNYYIRIPLSYFFPKDSMIYMSGKNAYITSSQSNKIRFVSAESEIPLGTTSGLNVINTDGTETGGTVLQSEVMNIGSGSTGVNVSNATGDINATSVSLSNPNTPLDSSINGLFGIFNKYTGEVEYLANASSCLRNAGTGLVDINAAAASETDPNGAYKQYKKFLDDNAGKCLTSAQEICLFTHNAAKDLPYII